MVLWYNCINKGVLKIKDEKLHFLNKKLYQSKKIVSSEETKLSELGETVTIIKNKTYNIIHVLKPTKVSFLKNCLVAKTIVKRVTTIV